jgi:hypothetical protein
MSEPARQMQVNPEDGTPEETVIALAKQRGYVTRKKQKRCLVWVNHHADGG